jgi:hopanoid biosynthesis associated RND transporter like protein HpnN
MLTSLVARVINFCLRHAVAVVLIGIAGAIAAGVYSARHFAINSDITGLLSSDLGWRKRERAFEAEFQRFDLIAVVVEAPTPELTSAATAALADALAKDKASFEMVANSSGAGFFERHGLLFLSEDALQKNLADLVKGAPLLQDLATDQSLRGLLAGLEDALIGVKQGKASLDDFARPLNMASDALENILKGQPASFSWRALTEGRPATKMELRGFIEVRPRLDFAALEPGQAATDALRRIAADIAPQYQAKVRLTGPIAMSDEEFGTIKENALRNGLITLAIVLFILWRALRSPRLILAVFVNLLLGLPFTAALGLFMVGSFNLISVYFAVLFVGIGVDFSIQYSVRYRAQRHEIEDLRKAIVSAGIHVAAPLTLAACATALGFFSFLPTAYKGVSELGQIAGFGMLIAFATSVTILPALIDLLGPPGEPEPLGYTQLAPVDNFLARHRIPIITGTAVIVIGLLPALYWLRFDFNPVNLRDPTSEAVATYLELSRDPATNTNAIEILAPSLAAADAMAAKLSKLPQVARTVTPSTFIPEGQAAKLPLIAKASQSLADAFDPRNAETPPTEAETIEALNQGVDWLTSVAEVRKGPGADATRRLASEVAALAKGSKAERDKAREVFVTPLSADLADLQAALQAQPIAEADLPGDFMRQWRTQDGRARISVAPKEDPGDNDAMRRFANAVLAVEPNATEGPISVLKAGETVIRAFIQAGAWALISIAILLWLVLRRIGDVALTLIPLALAGVVTLEICALTGLVLNFANIIAFPLLLGVGVAFKIYYIMAWREGQTHLLQTSLTRAVIFSALTTATAFGSLYFSSHPGTSSMGKLLALSLVTTLMAAVLFQPILMGRPRNPVPEKAT